MNDPYYKAGQYRIRDAKGDARFGDCGFSLDNAIDLAQQSRRDWESENPDDYPFQVIDRDDNVVWRDDEKH